MSPSTVDDESQSSHNKAHFIIRSSSWPTLLMENGVEEESKEIVYALEDCTASTAEQAVYAALRSLEEEELIARYIYEFCPHCHFTFLACVWAPERIGTTSDMICEYVLMAQVDRC